MYNCFKLLLHSPCSNSLIFSICVCHTHLHNWSAVFLLMYSCQNHPLSETNDFYSTSIALLGWFLSWRALLQWPDPCIILLRYISKLVQLVVQVQYHVNIIYSLGQTHTHIPQTKAISRNQVHVWFKNITSVYCIVITFDKFWSGYLQFDGNVIHMV